MNSTTTKALLACTLVAGPLYVVVGAIEAFVRPGFDPTRHDLSLLANGRWGWIHILLLVLTGLLTVAGAIGMRRALRGSRGETWGPLLIGLYGAGLIGAGVFVADPMNGFPPGTSADANAVSWHGILHFVCGGIGFLGLISACFVFARRFAALGERGWTIFSMATGVLYFAAFFGIASGSQQGGAVLTFVVLAFTAAVVLGWAWISALSFRVRDALPGG
ncbi:MAG: DUF998 domain-containing protein [Rubrobacter sp.]|nr:DUF998 domain-containing protein [Rubrobacter sp.]